MKHVGSAVTVLLLASAARAAPCREACLQEREMRIKQLEACLKEADKAPPEARPEARIECRRRVVVPACDRLPPCPEGEHAQSGIEIVSHYFADSPEGTPLREALFQPGQTVFLRYLGVLFPDPAAREFALFGDVVLRSGARVMQRHDKELRVASRIAAKDREVGHRFAGQTSFKLPADVAAGEYAVDLVLRDDKSRLSVTRGYRFRVAKAPASEK